MNTYYSILFTQIRPAINEQVSIALLLISDNNMIFKYSNDKISFLRKLIPTEAANLIKQYLEGISKEIRTFHAEQKEVSKFLKKTPSEYSNYSESYLNYLNSYSNNLITFSKPTKIDIKLDERNFQLLFEKFISDELSLNFDKEFLTKIERTQKKLYPKIINNVHLDIDIEKIKINEIQSPRLILPDTINIFGKNGKYLSGQFFDFEKKSNNLKADLSFYSNFIHEINDDGSNFIIGNEPEKSSKKNHSYWEDMKNYSKIKYVPLDEVDVIVEYIKDNDIKQIF